MLYQLLALLPVIQPPLFSVSLQDRCNNGVRVYPWIQTATGRGFEKFPAGRAMLTDKQSSPV